MFSAIRRRVHLSPATMIAGLALVFAMTGGAYAAKKYLITSTKQISPSVLKALQGKAGSNGAAGPQGPAGAKGDPGPAGAAGSAGTPGTNGINGTNGTSVTNTALAEGNAHCAKGGAEFKVGSGASTFACNGQNGQTGFTATLPNEATETGTYQLTSENGVGQIHGFSVDNISFPIPLAAPIALNHTIYVPEPETTVPAECENDEHPGAASVSNPEAQPGFLCFFNGQSEEMDEFEIEQPGFFGAGASVVGATVLAKPLAAGSYSEGTWAVTGTE